MTIQQVDRAPEDHGGNVGLIVQHLCIGRSSRGDLSIRCTADQKSIRLEQRLTHADNGPIR